MYRSRGGCVWRRLSLCSGKGDKNQDGHYVDLILESHEFSPEKRVNQYRGSGATG
jgi:hypothetical protein